MLLGAKAIGAILTQCFSIYAMMTYKTANRAMGGFVSHALISKIDDIMAKTLTNIDIGGEMSKVPILYKANTKVFDDRKLVTKWLKWYKDGKMTALTLAHWLLMLFINRVCKFFYVTVYFYFTPLTILAMYLGSIWFTN